MFFGSQATFMYMSIHARESSHEHAHGGSYEHFFHRPQDDQYFDALYVCMCVAMYVTTFCYLTLCQPMPG